MSDRINHADLALDADLETVGIPNYREAVTVGLREEMENDRKEWELKKFLTERQEDNMDDHYYPPEK